MFYQEQPHGDSSFIALRKICEEVSKYEKVALSKMEQMKFLVVMIIILIIIIKIILTNTF